VILTEATRDDVDRALHLLQIVSVRDVSEDPTLGGLVDELAVSTSRTAITGQAASCTIRSISSRALEVPS
jgi:hypothetical protein